MIEHEEVELKKLAYSNKDLKERIIHIATIKGVSEIVAIQVIWAQAEFPVHGFFEKC